MCISRITALLGKSYKGKRIVNSMDLSFFPTRRSLSKHSSRRCFWFSRLHSFLYAAAEADLEEAVRRVREAVSKLED